MNEDHRKTKNEYYRRRGVAIVDAPHRMQSPRCIERGSEPLHIIIQHQTQRTQRTVASHSIHKNTTSQIENNHEPVGNPYAAIAR
jgi:dephospho-CoA kinase